MPIQYGLLTCKHTITWYIWLVLDIYECCQRLAELHILICKRESTSFQINYYVGTSNMLSCKVDVTIQP
jgi:hypothetical protein